MISVGMYPNDVMVHRKCVNNRCQSRLNVGDRLDNKLSNLCWGTRSENVKDSIKHGTASCIRKGENHPHYKPTKPNI